MKIQRKCPVAVSRVYVPEELRGFSRANICSTCGRLWIKLITSFQECWKAFLFGMMFNFSFSENMFLWNVLLPLSLVNNALQEKIWSKCHVFVSLKTWVLAMDGGLSATETYSVDIFEGPMDFAQQLMMALMGGNAKNQGWEFQLPIFALP